MARKPIPPYRPKKASRTPTEHLIDDIHLRPGRVGGAHAAFGAPGPKVDLSQVLASWRTENFCEGEASIAGAVAGPAPPGQVAADAGEVRRTVSLSDGTLISFTVAEE